MAEAAETRRTHGRSRAYDRIRRLRGLAAAGLHSLPLDIRLRGGIEHAVMAVAASLIAYLPTQALGLREGFWAAITSLAVVQSEFAAARSTARDQFAGAAIGGTIGVAVVSAAGQGLPQYAGAVALSVLGAWLLRVSSAARLAAVTATIILLVPHKGSAESMMLSRVSEVGWGVVVGIAIVWIAGRLGAMLSRATGEQR